MDLVAIGLHVFVKWVTYFVIDSQGCQNFVFHLFLTGILLILQLFGQQY